MKLGARFMAFLFLYVSLATFLGSVLYLIYDDNKGDTASLRRQVQETAASNLKVLTVNRQLTEENTKLVENLLKIESKLQSIESEQGAVQEHFQKLKEGQMDLQNQISKKRPKISVPKGPIQIEILGPSKGNKEKLPTYNPPKNLGRDKKKAK